MWDDADSIVVKNGQAIGTLTGGFYAFPNSTVGGIENAMRVLDDGIIEYIPIRKFDKEQNDAT